MTAPIRRRCRGSPRRSLAFTSGAADARAHARWPAVANRQLMAAMLAAVLGITACMAPPNPTTPPRSFGSEPAGSSPSQFASSSATTSPAALPAIVTEAELPIAGVISLAPTVEGAWFVATGEPATVGLLSAAGIVRASAAGPAPVAVLASGSDVFLVEGEPDTGPANGPRTNVLERLDAATLEVRASVTLKELTTAATYTNGVVWTIGTEGDVTAYEDRTLAPVWTSHLDGRGPAAITAGTDAVWATIGKVGEGSDHGQYLVARIGLQDDHPIQTTILPGDGVGPLIAAGATAWLAAADYPVFDRLYLIDSHGNARAQADINTPAGMAVDAGRLWWVGVDGSAGAIDEATGARTPQLILPSGSGAAIAVDRTTAYVAAGDRVFVLSLPMQAP